MGNGLAGSATPVADAAIKMLGPIGGYIITKLVTSQNYAADEIEAVLEAETGFEKGEYFLGAMLALGVPEDNLKS
ncbi:hypothetical protein ACTPEM_22650, partial [Clostridioides difficile]